MSKYSSASTNHVRFCLHLSSEGGLYKLHHVAYPLEAGEMHFEFNFKEMNSHPKSGYCKNVEASIKLCQLIKVKKR